METVPALFKLSIVALIFGLGLRATPHDILYVWQRPGLLMRGVLAIDVLVPLLAALIVLAFALPRPIAIALMLLAVSPGAPLVAQKELRFGGRAEVVFSLSVATALFAIFTVPFSLTLFTRLFIADAAVESLSVARLVGVLFVIPLLVGAMVHVLTNDGVEKLSRFAIVFANALLVVVMAILLVRMLPEILALDLSVMVALACFCAGSLVIGHSMTGPYTEDRTALALMCAARHPGLALLVAASSFPREPVLPAVMEYVVVCTLISVPYAMWRKHRARASLRLVPPTL